MDELTDQEAFSFASRIMGEGIAHSAQMRIDPPLHIVTENSELWCTGGPAHRNENTMTRRYCRRCLTLAREMWNDLANEDEDEST